MFESGLRQEAHGDGGGTLARATPKKDPVPFDPSPRFPLVLVLVLVCLFVWAHSGEASIAKTGRQNAYREWLPQPSSVKLHQKAFRARL